jgi:hypothetical protein
LAATAHAAKSSTRAAVNTSPEPFSNIGVSLIEDGLVPFALWLAFTEPVWFFVLLGVSLVLMIVLIVTLVRFVSFVLRRLRGDVASA